VSISAAELIAERLVSYRDEVHKLKAVLQLCPIPVLLAHNDGDVILYVNPAYTFFLGGTILTVQDGAWLNHWCPEDREAIKNYWAAVVKNHITSSLRARYIFPPDGGLKNARITATVLESNGIISFVFPEICWDVQLPIQVIEAQNDP
jgi:hypothetical protein